MSENELELIEMIRTHDDPAKAMMIAIEIIAGYLLELAQTESSAVLSTDAH